MEPVLQELAPCHVIIGIISQYYGQFDVVFEKGTFDALEPNRDLQLRVMREARKVLRTEGGLLISITVRHSILTSHMDVYGQNCSEYVLRKRRDPASFSFAHACRFY